MKRLVCLLLLVSMVAALLIGCGSFKCDLCGKESDGEKYEVEVLGEELIYCDDCYEDMKSLGSLFG